MAPIAQLVEHWLSKGEVLMLVGPSGSGKTVLLTNLILDIYEGWFSRIHIWSPSIEVDNTWLPVNNYIRDQVKPNDREKYDFDSYDWVKPFKVSGGNPRPPSEQTPGNRVKHLKERLADSLQKKQTMM